MTEIIEIADDKGFYYGIRGQCKKELGRLTEAHCDWQEALKYDLPDEFRQDVKAEFKELGFK